MNSRRQSLTAPSGVGGGGGGGSRRILAATLTYTGNGGGTNGVAAFVTGTLPNPSTVLPGGTLQSIQCEFRSLIDYNITLNYEPLSGQDVVIPVLMRFTVGTACVFSPTIGLYGVLQGGGVTTLNVNNAIVTDDCVFSPDLIASWPASPSFVLFRFGSPNYSYEFDGYTTAYPGAGFTYNSLQVDGAIKVYYLFE